MRPSWRVNKRVDLGGTKPKSLSTQEILNQIQREQKEREREVRRLCAVTTIQAAVRGYQLRRDMSQLYISHYSIYKQTTDKTELEKSITAASMMLISHVSTSQLHLMNYQSHPLLGKLAWKILVNCNNLHPRALITTVSSFIRYPIVPPAYPSSSILSKLPPQLKVQFVDTLVSYATQGLFNYLAQEGDAILPLSQTSEKFIVSSNLSRFQPLLQQLMSHHEELSPLLVIKILSDMDSIEQFHPLLISLFNRRLVPTPDESTLVMFSCLFRHLRATSTLLHLFHQNFTKPYLPLFQRFIESSSVSTSQQELVIEMFISLCHDALSYQLYTEFYDDMYQTMVYAVKFITCTPLNHQIIQDLHSFVHHTSFPSSLIPIDTVLNGVTRFSTLSVKLGEIFKHIGMPMEMWYKETITIRRGFLIEDSLAQLRSTNIRDAKIRFVDQFGVEEEGVDGGGITRDYLVSALSACIETLHLFERNSNGILTFGCVKNILTGEYSEEELYVFVGQLIGKCLHDNICLDVFFSDDILIGLVDPNDKSININTLASIDDSVASNLYKLTQMSEEAIQAMDLTFTYDNIDLIKGGRYVQVTKANINYYVSCVIYYITHIRNSRKMESLRKGLRCIIDDRDIKLLFPDELQQWLSGKSNVIDVNEWRENTVYHGREPTDKDVEWFWEIVQEMTEEERSLLLQFATSMVKPPFFGFRSLNPHFAIHFTEQGDEHLPSSSTCAYLLRLPTYSSKTVMKRQLMKAITSKAGFGLQ